jgi:prevent-host-death family protein
MDRISVRELRQRASVWLTEVERGRRFEITNRGRPVALLVPIPPGNEIERLTAAGRLSVPRGKLSQLAPPLPAIPGQPLPSEVLEQMRADER